MPLQVWQVVSQVHHAVIFFFTFLLHRAWYAVSLYHGLVTAELVSLQDEELARKVGALDVDG